jgi:putative transposase
LPLGDRVRANIIIFGIIPLVYSYQKEFCIIALIPGLPYYLNSNARSKTRIINMKAYSIDIRQKIIDAYNNQEGSQRKLAKRFRVSLSFVQSLLKRYRETGSVNPKPHGGGQTPKLTPQQLALIPQFVKEDNNATLDELCEKLYQKTQVRISRATMGRVLQTFKLPRKKISTRERVRQVEPEKAAS